MAEVIKEGDFVELDYTGKITDDSIVFDTTMEADAKKNNLYDAKTKYEPVSICIGKRHVIEGLDKGLVGKEIGKEYLFRVKPEEAFGQKNPKMIQLIATNKFRAQGITPMPGLQVNMDGVLGTIRAVSGGRTIVDFNHPLSGKELEYRATVKRLITDAEGKVDAVIKILGLKMERAIAGETLTLKSGNDVPKNVQDDISKAITGLVPEIKQVSFETVTKKPEEKGQADNKI